MGWMLCATGCPNTLAPPQEKQAEASPPDASSPESTAVEEQVSPEPEARPEEPTIQEASPEPLAEPLPEPQPEPSPEPQPEPEKVNTPPTIADPGPQKIAEEQDWKLQLQIQDDDGDPLWIYILASPPGGRWDANTKTFSFRPDFIQGGKTYTLEVLADDGRAQTTRKIDIIVEDTIKPPAPTIKTRTTRSDHERLVVEQKTDSYLDSPGYAGRTIQANITIPNAVSGKTFPVKLQLHGFGGNTYAGGDGSEFFIVPHDPMNTYWWGYAESLPVKPPTSGAKIPPYTQRRVLHLLSWVLKTYPHADPERVYITGGSMGGAGAKTIGLMHGRHFCYVEATIGQAIPRNHRPSRIKQLSTLWGKPDDQTLDAFGALLWDEMDLTRVLRDIPEAMNQFVFTKHSKDDPTIHFGAVMHASPLTSLSLYQAFQSLHIGHYTVWDEGGHGSADPVLGDFWSDWGWHRVKDATTYLRRDLAFPAFSASSADEDAGTGKGNGKQTWDPEKGYAGQVSVPQDTGWDGQVAGTHNRHLRWDSTKIVDTFDRFSMPLMLLKGQGNPPPRTGYPTQGNRYDGPLPVLVDVTPRRLQHFRIAPNETISYTYGTLTGTEKADAKGDVTFKRLPITDQWTTLTLTRSR